MTPVSAISRSWWMLISGLALAANPTAQAQHALYVEHGKEVHLVRAARDNKPLVEQNGKLVSASGRRFALKEVAEYAPLFISVRDIVTRSSALQDVSSGARMNHTLHFQADFESPYTLDRVFLVLDMQAEESGHGLFVWEIGQLQARVPRTVSLAVPLTGAMGEGNYRLHLFVDGLEVFHSGISFTAIESTLDRMIAKRVQDAPDGPPQPFIGPSPEYPPALLKARVKGEAVIAMRIGPNGSPREPTVHSATDPAFGEAALAAIRQWRFLPAIKDGQPVGKAVHMPFKFEPPPPKGAKKS